jgi:hypothetical protein
MNAEWGDERSRELVGLLHFDLVVAGVRVTPLGVKHALAFQSIKHSTPFHD